MKSRGLEININIGKLAGSLVQSVPNLYYFYLNYTNNANFGQKTFKKMG